MPISHHEAKRPKDKLNNHSSLGQFLEKEKQGLLRHMANNVFCKTANKTTSLLPRGRRHNAFSKHTPTTSSRCVTEQLHQCLNREFKCHELKGRKEGEDMEYHKFKSQFPKQFLYCLEICETWQIKKWLRMPTALRSVSANMCISRNQCWN